jgi:hypothetical protein
MWIDVHWHLDVDSLPEVHAEDGLGFEYQFFAVLEVIVHKSDHSQYLLLLLWFVFEIARVATLGFTVVKIMGEWKACCIQIRGVLVIGNWGVVG